MQWSQFWRFYKESNACIEKFQVFIRPPALKFSKKFFDVPRSLPILNSL